METVDEEHPMVDHDALEMRNMSAVGPRSHLGRPSSRASTLRVQYKSSRAPSRVASMSTVNGITPYSGKRLQPDDAVSMHSHMTNDRARLNNSTSYHNHPTPSQHQDFDAIDSEEEEDEMKRIGDGSSGGGDKKRHRSVSDDHESSDEERDVRLAATLPHPKHHDIPPVAAAAPDLSEDEYETARSVRSYRHPRQSRSLYKKKRPRGAQSDTDISRHVGYPASARRHSSQQRRQRPQRPPMAGEEYDSPPSDYYKNEDFMRSKKGGAYV